MFSICQLGCISFTRWVAFQPLGTQGIDEDSASRGSNTDSEHCHGKHSLTPINPFLISDLTLSNLSLGNTTEGSLDGCLGDPSECHESTFLVIVFLLHASYKGSNPSEGNTNENDANAEAQKLRIDLPDEDTSTYGTE